jgi:hypothetical protein
MAVTWEKLALHKDKLSNLNDVGNIVTEIDTGALANPHE